MYLNEEQYFPVAFAVETEIDVLNPECDETTECTSYGSKTKPVPQSETEFMLGVEKSCDVCETKDRRWSKYSSQK